MRRALTLALAGGWLAAVWGSIAVGGGPVLGDPGAVLPRILRNAYRSDRPVFAYYDAIYARSLHGFQPSYEFVNISTASIFSPSAGRQAYHYYSGDLLHEDFAALRNTLSISTLLRNTSAMDRLTGHVWISDPNVTAVLHYDAVNNVFMQLHGTKLVTLHPPSHVSSLQIYGRLHPHACQSRLDQHCSLDPEGRGLPFSFATSGHVPLVTDCAAVPAGIQVMLRAGDMLVLPPYWFHKTVTASASASVTFWWEAAQSTVFEDALALALPFEVDWGEDLLTAAAFVYTQAFLDALDPQASDSGVTALTTHLLQERYREDRGVLAQVPRARSCVSDAVAAKSRRYAARAARQLATGLLRPAASQSADAQDPPPLVAMERDLRCLNTELAAQFQVGLHLPAAGCASAGRRRARTLNEQAVLAMKAADYIEEVLYAVAGLTRDPGATHREKARTAVALLATFLQTA